MDLRGTHFVLGVSIAALIGLAAVSAHRSSAEQGGGDGRRAAILARYMGLVWAWAAIAVFITYALIMVRAADWPGVVVLATIGSGICVFVSDVLERDANNGTADRRIIDLVGQLAKVQFVAACLVIGGVLKWGGLSLSARDPRWAAFNLLASTAIGIAGLSGYAIAVLRPARRAEPAAGPTSTGPARRPRRPMARVV
jgi:hypothetical protein